MYLYDAIDKDMLRDRSSEFRLQTGRRLAGEITEDQFKPLRLQNGVYLQLHAYMLRIAVPYGTLSGNEEFWKRIDEHSLDPGTYDLLYRSGVRVGQAPWAERTMLRARRDTTQAQLIVGVPALRRDHPDAWILAVLNGVLGDGMSSRLFLSVREAQGLAYDVSSGLVDYADAGSLEVSAGVDPERLPAALDAVLVELARLRDEAVPEDELAKTKAYLSGGLELRMDETRHLASWIGGQEALHDRVLDLDEALAAVAAVDAADVQRLAGELVRDEGLRLAVVAPARHLRGLERRLKLPA